jgi:hypothetical protein
MSKGLSTLQRRILGLLDGSIPHKVFTPGTLTTAQLRAELIQADLMSSDQERKLAMFTIRRACRSLVHRAYITCTYEIDNDNPGRRVATWTSVIKRRP